jgi:hypothetical protein
MPTSNWQTNPLPGMQIPAGAQFFNASIHISGMTMNNNDPVADESDGSADGSGGGNTNNSNNPWGSNAPPPEVLQKAMEMAMTQVVERLADANNNGNTITPPSASTGGNDPSLPPSPQIQNVQGNLPPPLAKAFSTILANEQLRRGIAENLARAAPALLDPRCQGVMLSVYVPPGPEHPNRGKMPGGVGGMSSGTITTAASVNNGNGSSPQSPSSGTTDANNKGSWFQKILSSPTTTPEVVTASGEDSEVSTPTAEKSDSGDEDNRAKLERKAAKRLLFKSRSKNPEKGSAGSNDKNSNGGEEDEGEDEASSAAASASNTKLPTTISSAKSRQARAQTAMLKRSRNILNIEALCHTSIPLPVPQDPVKKKAWHGWLTRQCNARFFRRNKAKLEETLLSSELYVVSPLQNNGNDDNGNDNDDGTAGDEGGPLRQISPTLRAMLSVKDCTADMTEVVRVAVEIEAERTLRNMVRAFSL